MTNAASNVPRKWRPSLGLLITAVVGVLVLLPFVALMGARVTSNQFVRETEGNLHVQAAIYAAVYANGFRAAGGDASQGNRLTRAQQIELEQPWRPIDATLVSSSASILGPRPDPNPAPGEDDVPAPLIDRLSQIARDAQISTLAGFLAVDHTGQIIAATGSDRGNIAHIPEVAEALNGAISRAARWRVEEYRNHSIRSISRDTKFRVYVAHPVVVDAHVVGAIYLSRTPSNLNKYLFQQRNAFMWLVGAVLLSASVIGVFLWRFLTRPLGQLQDQARDIASGKPGQALPKYGAKELASLGQSLMDMGTSLRQKSAGLETYTKHATHELKSPVTSIIGAAELLENPDITPERQALLVSNIKSDAARMDRLLLRMREMVRGQMLTDPDPVTLDDLLVELQEPYEDMRVDAAPGSAQHVLPLPRSAALICLRHLLENAAEHEAGTVILNYDHLTGVLSVNDNGAGLSEANLSKATEPFFTTKRESGGTGMGLSICAEIIAQVGGKLSISNTDDGASVKLTFPRNEDL